MSGKKRGRSKGDGSKYKPEYAEQVYKLRLLGLSLKEIATFFGVCHKTLEYWKEEHADFATALREGAEPADANVAVSLYKRALGYSHPAEKIFNHNGEIIRAETTTHYPPETGAAIRWLAVRQPGRWREKPLGFDDEAPPPVNVTIEMEEGTVDDEDS